MGSHDAESTSRLDREINNRAIIELLYKALEQGDAPTVAQLVARDVEWWFHGPHQCQHMMRLLTGQRPSQVGFKFETRSVEEVKGHVDCVIGEGWEGSQVYWVHVWRLKDGMVTELREYFNTRLTVMDCSGAWDVARCTTLWESFLPMHPLLPSLPALLLAI